MTSGSDAPKAGVSKSGFTDIPGAVSNLGSYVADQCAIGAVTPWRLPQVASGPAPEGGFWT